MDSAFSALQDACWRLYDAVMAGRLQAAGAAAVLLLALSSCATGPTQAVTESDLSDTPCHSPFVADVDTSVAGEATPEAAAMAWSKSKSPFTPSGAPHGGWKSSHEQTVRSGDWVVGVSRTISGGWIVSGLGCGAAQS